VVNKHPLGEVGFFKALNFYGLRPSLFAPSAPNFNEFIGTPPSSASHDLLQFLSKNPRVPRDLPMSLWEKELDKVLVAALLRLSYQIPFGVGSWFGGSSEA